jgi:S1-C subfamily serine protease
MEMVRVSGQQGVPVITIDGQIVIGFNQPRLMQLLKPKLGASIADAASQAKRHPGIPSSGAFVGRVRPGTPADQAGLSKGDVIVALGGLPVDTADALHRLIPQMPKGRDVSLTYIRKGKQHDTLVRL